MPENKRPPFLAAEKLHLLCLIRAENWTRFLSLKRTKVNACLNRFGTQFGFQMGLCVVVQSIKLP